MESHLSFHLYVASWCEGCQAFPQMLFPSEPSHCLWPLCHLGSLTLSSGLCFPHLTSNSDLILWCEEQMTPGILLEAFPWQGSCTPTRPRGVGRLAKTGANPKGAWAVCSLMAEEGPPHSGIGGWTPRLSIVPTPTLQEQEARCSCEKLLDVGEEAAPGTWALITDSPAAGFFLARALIPTGH